MWSPPRSRSTVGGFLLCVLTLAGCAGTPGESASRVSRASEFQEPICAECIDALRINGWCATCEIGYVHSVPMRSAWLHEAFDAHGHEIEDWSHECLDCGDALMSDGYCPHCSYGFIDGKLYFTKLTWSLGLGAVVDLWTLDCETCRTHPGRAGWCDRCDRGLVGNAAFDDRGKFATARMEWQRLHDALAQEAGCERCVIYFYKGLECGACSREKRRAASLEEAKTTPPK